jgi:diguanylate cyclase (GGDEF)-like protein
MVHDPPHRRWPAILTAAAIGYTTGTVLTRHALIRQLTAARAIAELDPLTGLPNRRALITEVHARLAAGTPTVLALLDLDDFKTVNDTYGHPVGDDLLTVVATRLRTAAAPDGYAARLAGDEFVVLFTGHGTDPAGTVTGLLSMLAEPVHLPAATLRPHASAGVATTGHTCSSWRDLITRADRALYRAKASGKHVAVYDHIDTADPDETPARPYQRRRSRC